MDNNEDIILVEEIDEQYEERDPVFAVYREPDGTVSFISVHDPEGTAYMLSRILSHILESKLG